MLYGLLLVVIWFATSLKCYTVAYDHFMFVLLCSLNRFSIIDISILPPIYSLHRSISIGNHMGFECNLGNNCTSNRQSNCTSDSECNL